MATIRLLDEINRLFEEMVRDPWARPSRTQPAPRPGKQRETHLDVELPIEGGGRGDVAVSIEGNRLTVTIGRRSTVPGKSEQQEKIQRSFVLPEDADVTKVEARFEGEVLHVRIGLAEKKG
jgi:HSP20 family molecular chaperone IbpA